MAKYIKNNSGVTKTWVGQQLANQEYYLIQQAELVQWANNSTLLSDIGNGNAVVAKSNDGTQNIVDVATAINYLKDEDLTPRDSDGSPLSRTKITTTGWHYQLHGLEFETSVKDSNYAKKADGTNFGFTVMKFYKDVSGTETEITGDDLNQTFLDANCVKTIIDWEPTHDVEIVGGFLKQSSIPSTDVRMWVVGVPDVPEAYGGSKLFASNINLKYVGLEDGVKVDGRAPKYLTYSATNHTNKIRLILRHGAGVKHKLSMIFEIFKA